MATPAASGPPKGPLTYMEWYDSKPDPLSGGYGPLYERHAIANGIGGHTLLRQAVQATQAIPKVYLVLVQRLGAYEIQTMHRPTTYELDPISQTGWDGRHFAFLGDVRGGNIIKTVEVPADVFEFAGAQKVPTIDNMTALMAAHPDVELLGPMAANAPDSEEVDTRLCLQVPQPYVRIVLDRRLTPRLGRASHGCHRRQPSHQM